MAVRRPARTDWTVLVITSGLAVTITAAGTYLTDRAKAASEARLRKCEIASAFLSDETPSPYMDARTRQSVTQAAGALLDDCLKER